MSVFCQIEFMIDRGAASRTCTHTLSSNWQLTDTTFVRSGCVFVYVWVCRVLEVNVSWQVFAYSEFVIEGHEIDWRCGWMKRDVSKKPPKKETSCWIWKDTVKKTFLDDNTSYWIKNLSVLFYGSFNVAVTGSNWLHCTRQITSRKSQFAVCDWSCVRDMVTCLNHNFRGCHKVVQ